MCVNYISLNNITVLNSYPLLLILKFLSLFYDVKYFGNINLFFSYNQICIAKENNFKTFFVTKFCQF